MFKIKIKRKGIKSYVFFVRCVCSCIFIFVVVFFIITKKYCVNKILLLSLMQHFYQFYKFFGEEKSQGEESIVLSWSGFCEQESLYLKTSFFLSFTGKCPLMMRR